MLQTITVSSEPRRPTSATAFVKHLARKAMQPKSTAGEAATAPQNGMARITSVLPVDRAELGKLARWVPAKETALLLEIFDRAERDPDLTRPAMLLCLAYSERVARMLDQDPLPTLTKKIRDCLQQLRERHGL
jgi:hypothetical protein